MPHGTPDWGLIAVGTLGYSLDDLAELAARLDSPVIYDRRGQVVLLDSFEHGLGLCLPVAIAAGDAYALRDDASRHGSVSLQFQMAGAAMSGGTVTWIVPILGLPRCGIEISFGYSQHVATVQWSMQYYDGLQQHQAFVAYIVATGALQYLDHTGAFQTFGAVTPFYVSDQPTHTAKLVADFDTHYYMRFLLDQSVYDLTPYAVRSTVSIVGPRLEAGFATSGDLGQDSRSTVDRCILTQNEPT